MKYEIDAINDMKIVFFINKYYTFFIFIRIIQNLLQILTISNNYQIIKSGRSF